MTISCQACGHQLHGAERYAGRKVACPKCRTTVQVPSGNAHSTPSAIPAEAWFVAYPQGRQIGPVTREQLQRAMTEGKIYSDCLVQRHGSGQWQPAIGVANYFGLSLAPNPANAVPAVPKPTAPFPQPSRPRLTSRQIREKLTYLGLIFGSYVALCLLSAAVASSSSNPNALGLGVTFSIFPGLVLLAAALLGFAMGLFEWGFSGASGALLRTIKFTNSNEGLKTLIYVKAIAVLLLAYACAATGLVLGAIDVEEVGQGITAKFEGRDLEAEKFEMEQRELAEKAAQQRQREHEARIAAAEAAERASPKGQWQPILFFYDTPEQMLASAEYDLQERKKDRTEYRKGALEINPSRKEDMTFQLKEQSFDYSMEILAHRRDFLATMKDAMPTPEVKQLWITERDFVTRKMADLTALSEYLETRSRDGQLAQNQCKITQGHIAVWKNWLDEIDKILDRWDRSLSRQSL